MNISTLVDGAMRTKLNDRYNNVTLHSIVSQSNILPLKIKLDWLLFLFFIKNSMEKITMISILN